MFSRTPSVAKIDFSRSIGAERKDAGFERRARREARHRPAGAHHLAGGFLKAAKRTHRFALAVALGAGKAEDFAAANIECDFLKPRGAQVSRREHDVGRGCRGPHRIFRLDRPSDHERDQIVFRQRLIDLVGALADAVAKNCDAVGKRQDLRQPVADIDDRHARRHDAPDDLGELFDAGNVQARSRLVEQQDLRVRGQCLDDLEKLPLRTAQLANQRIRRDAKVVGRELLCRPLPLSRQRLWPVAGAQQQVLGDRQLAHQRVVLINHGQAELTRQQRVGAGERLAHDGDAAFIGSDGAGGNPEQRALAGTVFSKHRMDFAGAAFEIDAVERLHAGIALGYARQLERGYRIHLTPKERGFVRRDERKSGKLMSRSKVGAERAWHKVRARPTPSPFRTLTASRTSPSSYRCPRAWSATRFQEWPRCIGL